MRHLAAQSVDTSLPVGTFYYEDFSKRLVENLRARFDYDYKVIVILYGRIIRPYKITGLMLKLIQTSLIIQCF